VHATVRQCARRMCSSADKMQRRRRSMLHAVLLPALSLADAAYQLRALSTRAPGLLAVLTSKPAATPGLECALGHSCPSPLAALQRAVQAVDNVLSALMPRSARAEKRCGIFPGSGRLRSLTWCSPFVLLTGAALGWSRKDEQAGLAARTAAWRIVEHMYEALPAADIKQRIQPAFASNAVRRMPAASRCAAACAWWAWPSCGQVLPALPAEGFIILAASLLPL